MAIGLVLSGAGVYFLFLRPPDMSPPSYNPPNSSVNFSYTPEPSGNEVNPMQVNALLVPLVNGSSKSLLELSIAGTFVSNPSQVSFLFYSSFNATIVKQNNGSGNGVGVWRTYAEQTFDNKPGTTIEYLFNRTGTSQDSTSFTSALATVSISDLPYVSEPGKYTIIFPFSYLGGGEPAYGGFFDLCAPAGYILTSADESFQTSPLTCPGGASSYRFRIDQTLQLVVTLENSAMEKEYSSNQTWGLFALGVGVPAIISSIAFLNAGSDVKQEELTKLVRELNERLAAQQGVEPRVPTPDSSLATLNGLELDSKQLVRDVLSAFLDVSKYAGLPLMLLGALYALVDGTKGLPLFAVGLAYLFLPLLPRTRLNKGVLYPVLIAGASAVFVGAMAFYFAVAPNPGSLESAGYYSLIGTSLALFLAGIADLSLQSTRVAIENRINKLDVGLREEQTARVVDAVSKELEKSREEDAEKWGEEED